jgi:hypothetical protein
LLVVCDPGNLIEESDETNNVRVIEVCRPGDQFNVHLDAAQDNLPLILNPLKPDVPLRLTIKLDEFNAGFTVQQLPSELRALCAATATTGSGGRTIELIPVIAGIPLPGVPLAYATVQVNVTLFDTAPPGAPPDDRIGTIETGADHVWINQHTDGHQVLRWSTPGFQVYFGSATGQHYLIKDTGPLEDWVDLENAPINGTGDTSFATLVNAAEQLIESTNQLIVFHRQAFFYDLLLALFDPGQTDLQLTAPDGRQTGSTPTGEIVQAIPGSAYFPSVPLVVVVSPSSGPYETDVRGRSTGGFALITGLIDPREVLAQEAVSGTIADDQTLVYAVNVDSDAGSLHTTLDLRASLGLFPAFIDRLEETGGIMDHEIANALRQKIRNAQVALASGNTNAVHGILSAFMNQVRAQRGKKITLDAADSLTAYASLLLDSLS